MALAFFLNKEQLSEPEEPKIFVRASLGESMVNVVDIIPGLVRIPMSGCLTSDALRDIEFGDFRTLIDAANKWLSSHLDFAVITCETITLMKKDGENFDLKNRDTCFYDVSFQAKYILKALRLYIQRRKEKISVEKCQRLHFIDFVPKKLNESNSKPEFEKIEDLMNQINEKIKTGEICDKIVSVNMTEYETGFDWSMDPMRTFGEQYYKNCVQFLRVFFDKNSKGEELIDMKDFIPKIVSERGFFRRVKFEHQSELFKELEEWTSKEAIQRIINIKTVYLTLNSKGHVDHSVMYFTTPGDVKTFLRVFYVKSFNSDIESNIDRRIKLTASQFTPKSNKETLSNLVTRINDKVIKDYKSGGGGLICAEIINCFSRKLTINECEKVANKSLQTFRIEANTGYIYFVFRVYTDTGQ